MDGIFISVALACMFVFPFFIASLYKSNSPKRREEALAKIYSEGHVVTAVLKKSRGLRDDPYSRTRSGYTDMGIYEYEYKGRKYKYKLFQENLPTTIKLYFRKSPRKAQTDVVLAMSKTNWFLIVAVVATVIYFLGYFSAI